MTPEAYNAFTQALQQKATTNEQVQGLIALGSMAAQDYLPDQWSDHDFFLIVTTGSQAHFHNDLSWLPDAANIALQIRETSHGNKVIYQNGHLLEYAIFDAAELNLARINRYRVLVDKTNIAERCAQLQTDSSQWRQQAIADDDSIFGQFLINLHVGFGRYHRGEQLTAHQFVKMYALTHLLTLLYKHLPAANKGILDNLDAARRFEKVFPALGQQLNKAMLQPVPIAALRLLDIAAQQLPSYLPNYPETAVAVVRRYLQQSV